MQGSPAAVPVEGATPSPRSPRAAIQGVERVEPEADKGLKKNAVGMLSSVVIGIASTAPAYSLAVTLGLDRRRGRRRSQVAGDHDRLVRPDDPDRELLLLPEQGRPRLRHHLQLGDPSHRAEDRWVTGWVMVAADIIVMASLAQITGTYFFLLFGLNSLANSLFWVTAVGVAFLVIMSVDHRHRHRDLRSRAVVPARASST